jgi:hypothetical protein
MSLGYAAGQPVVFDQWGRSHTARELVGVIVALVGQWWRAHECGAVEVAEALEVEIIVRRRMVLLLETMDGE